MRLIVAMNHPLIAVASSNKGVFLAWVTIKAD